MAQLTARELYERYASAVAYIAVELPSCDHSAGSAFHVGDGVFLTARHVLENNRIVEIATTVDQYVPDPEGNVQIDGRQGRFRLIPAGHGKLIMGPFFHPDPGVDVAACARMFGSI